MKNTFKRVISIIVSTCIIFIMGVTAITSFAYTIPGNDLMMYVDIVYENGGTIRADVIFENMPNLTTGGFYINVGAGWNIIQNENDYHYGVKSTSDDGLYYNNYVVATNGTGRFIAFNNAYSNGIDCNGRFCYFYIERTSVNNPMNSIINCSFGNTGILYGANNVSLINQVNNPVMLSSYEYIIGDADGNGIIDGLDSTLILTKTANNTSYNVYDIRNTYTSIFPDAVCAAAPDGDEDGIIDSDDSEIVLQAYVAFSVGHIPSSNVGQVAIYEVFQ